MNCVICKKGVTHPGTATITLERGTLTLVVKHAPARICENCGEEYLDEQTTGRLLLEAEQASKAGIQVDVREYAAV